MCLTCSTSLFKHSESPPGSKLVVLDNLEQLTSDSLSGSYSEKDFKSLKNRARSKYVSSDLSIKLVNVARESHSGMEKAYWRTWHCASVIEQKGKKLTSKYCGSRWCLVCNRIRTAKMIRGYGDTLNSFDQPMFVTLTIPNVKDVDLKKTIENMIVTFRKIQKNLKFRKINMIGVRKLECTYNTETDEYHPHFHFIVDGLSEAEELVNGWLKSYPSANRGAQDIAPATKGSVLELFKYTTKLVNSLGKKKKGKLAKTSQIVSVKALDVIFSAMQGKRTFQPFGIKKAKDLENCEEITDLDAQLYEQLEVDRVQRWRWLIDGWASVDDLMDTGEVVYLGSLRFIPTKKELDFMERFQV